jgi:hypothetical protein
MKMDAWLGSRYNLPMSRSLEEVRQLALELPPEQRLSLALELSDGLPPHPGLGEHEPGYEEWFRAGVEEALADTSKAIPHKDVVEDIANVLRAAREAQRLKPSS